MKPVMIVECNRCHARLKLDPEKAGVAGARVRCAKCQNVFAVAPPGTPAPGLREAPAARTSETPKPKPAKPAASAPRLPANVQAATVLDTDLPVKQRFLRMTILTATATAGLLFGLLAMGVRPTPTSIGLLLKYGAKGLPPGVQVLHYDGRIVVVEAGSRRLRVAGEVLNFTPARKPGPDLRLEVLNFSGEFLARKDQTCCPAGLEPYGRGEFFIELDLPSGSIGRYKISLVK
jgi:predicted Zn finger-like uncharacterized protein